MASCYFHDESHTLASAIRPALEAAAAADNAFVACTLVHPLDGHIQVDAPSEAMVRTALSSVKDQVSEMRRHLTRSAAAGPN